MEIVLDLIYKNMAIFVYKMKNLKNISFINKRYKVICAVFVKE